MFTVDYCSYRTWYYYFVIGLTVIGILDATYQYLYNDQYKGGRRTAATIFLICLFLLALIRCPKPYEFSLLDDEEMSWLNPLTLASVGSFFAVLALLLALWGERSCYVWGVLSSGRPNRQLPHKVPNM